MEPPRETISLLLTTILGGLALTYAITELQATLGEEGFSTPFHSMFLFIVFVSIWLRFIPGNISHIRRLERWPSTSVNTWLLDLSVITLESMIIVFMAKPSVDNPEMFYYSMLVLLFTDIGWLAAMVHGVKRKTRPEPQWIWMWLNIPSAVVIVAVCLLNLLEPELHLLANNYVLMAVLIVFGLSAAIDIFRSVPDWFGRPRRPELSRQERKTYEKYMEEAIDEAKESLLSKGIPIGAILVENENIIGRGHNRRVQDGNPMAHAEIECLKSTGRKRSYRSATLVSTLMPCCLCAGAIVQFGIKKVVVGEAKNFEGARSFLEDCGVRVIVLDMDECEEMLRKYIKSNPMIWKEDIGKP